MANPKTLVELYFKDLDPGKEVLERMPLADWEKFGEGYRCRWVVAPHKFNKRGIDRVSRRFYMKHTGDRFELFEANSIESDLPRGFSHTRESADKRLYKMAVDFTKEQNRVYDYTIEDLVKQETEQNS